MVLEMVLESNLLPALAKATLTVRMAAAALILAYVRVPSLPKSVMEDVDLAILSPMQMQPRHSPASGGEGGLYKAEGETFIA
jgi:hypothetical protein